MSDRSVKRPGNLCLFLLMTLTALIAPPARAQDVDERQRLLNQRQKLTARIDHLRREQELLLFQKTAYQSDSKYLLLDTRSGKGLMKYRNRILRSFSIARTDRSSRRPKPGPRILSEKIEGPPQARMLVFGNDLVVHTKRFAGRSRIPKGSSSLTIGTKDMAAIYHAIERGAALYVIN
jgi:hypothetical protein